jgi:ribosomal protein L4
MAEKKVKKIKAEDEEAAEAPSKATPGMLRVYDLKGNVSGETPLPEAFKSEVRPDVIRRAVTAIEANKRQPYAPSPTAGARHSVETARLPPNRPTTWAAGARTRRRSKRTWARRSTRRSS